MSNLEELDQHSVSEVRIIAAEKDVNLMVVVETVDLRQKVKKDLISGDLLCYLRDMTLKTQD